MESTAAREVARNGHSGGRYAAEGSRPTHSYFWPRSYKFTNWTDGREHHPSAHSDATFSGPVPHLC